MIALIIIIAIVVILALVVMGSYNGLVKTKIKPKKHSQPWMFI